MKKAYTKPLILFDSFELSQSIATGCEAITGAEPYSCPYEDEESGMMLFNSDMVGVCVDTPVPGIHDGLCYHTPTGLNNTFAS